MIKIIDLPCINLETYKGMEENLDKELAEKIIERRREIGGFNSIGQLLEIEGIDGDVLAKISRLYTVTTTAVYYKNLEFILKGDDINKDKRIDYIINYKDGNSVKDKKDGSGKCKFSVEVIFAPMARKYYRKGSTTTIEYCDWGDPFDEPEPDELI